MFQVVKVPVDVMILRRWKNIYLKGKRGERLEEKTAEKMTDAEGKEKGGCGRGHGRLIREKLHTWNTVNLETS